MFDSDTVSIGVRGDNDHAELTGDWAIVSLPQGRDVQIELSTYIISGADR